MSERTIKITVEWSAAEAEAFAQFLKRVLLDDYQRRAGDEEEAYLMRDAGLAVQKALRDIGISPR